MFAEGTCTLDHPQALPLQSRKPAGVFSQLPNYAWAMIDLLQETLLQCSACSVAYNNIYYVDCKEKGRGYVIIEIG